LGLLVEGSVPHAKKWKIGKNSAKSQTIFKKKNKDFKFFCESG